MTACHNLKDLSSDRVKVAKRACHALDERFVKAFDRVGRDGIQVTVFSPQEMKVLSAAADDDAKHWA